MKAPIRSDKPGETDRRQHIRVVANGSVIVYGGETMRGRLVDISSGGMLMRLLEGERGFMSGEHVQVELHLDRSGATWLLFLGEVVRLAQCDVAIRFTSVPLEFVNVVRSALLSSLEGAATPHVLLVDPIAQRRAPFAALLRRAGCRVVEVTTPLDAIAHLGGSAIQSWVVAISSTVPYNVADELQRFLAESNPSLEVRMLGSTLPTSALAWFTAVPRRPN